MASVGLRARPLRAALSALGIAIGTAAIVGGPRVVLLLAGRAARGDRPARHEPADGRGRTELHRRGGEAAARSAGADHAPGQRPAGGTHRPDEDEKVYRNSMIPEGNTGGLQVRATSLNLPSVLSTGVARGNWLNEGTAREPVAVLGRPPHNGWASTGSTPISGSGWDGQWFNVAGILKPSPLAPDIDNSALIGYPAAAEVPRLRRASSAASRRPARRARSTCAPPPVTRRRCSRCSRGPPTPRRRTR